MSEDPLGRRFAATDIDDEADDKVGEVEAAVESVIEGAEVAISVLGAAEGLVGTGQHPLEGTWHSVDPFEMRQVPGLAMTDYPSPKYMNVFTKLVIAAIGIASLT